MPRVAPPGIALMLFTAIGAGSATASDSFGTLAGCLIGVDTDAALKLIEAGEPAVILEGDHLAFPALGKGCDLSRGETVSATQGSVRAYHDAICYIGDSEWAADFTIAFDDDTATVTDSKGTVLELTRCGP